VGVEGGEREMRSKAKFLVISLVVVAVASALLYAPLTSAFQSDGEQKPDVDFAEHHRHEHRFKARLIRWFLGHSESVEVEGTTVALFKDMLIVDTVEGQIRIHLPQAWIVDGELTMRGELFESGYLSVGEEVTVKALRADVIDREGLRIYLLLGYEIIDESGVHAYGVLPFNIET